MFEMLGQVDLKIVATLNGFAGLSATRDEFVGFVGAFVLFKGMVPMLFFWGLWFLAEPDRRRRWCNLLAMLFVSGLALLTGRALAVLLPFRLRPFHTGEFTIPYGMHAGVLDGWSSLPSDHAVFFFSLATGLFLVNRLAGLLAYLHAILIISLPRIYLGLHYPSDLYVGALVGVAMTLLLLPLTARLIGRLGIPELEPGYRHLWYPALFLATYIVAGMFGPLLAAFRMARQLLETI